jgi:hypothetical protein
MKGPIAPNRSSTVIGPACQAARRREQARSRRPRGLSRSTNPPRERTRPGGARGRGGRIGRTVERHGQGASSATTAPIGSILERSTRSEQYGHTSPKRAPLAGLPARCSTQHVLIWPPSSSPQVHPSGTERRFRARQGGRAMRHYAWLPLAAVAGRAMAQGLRQSDPRPSWRPGARIFTGRGLRGAYWQRPSLSWDVTLQGCLNGTPGRPRSADLAGTR